MRKQLRKSLGTASLIAVVGLMLGMNLDVGSRWNDERSFSLVDAVSAATRSGMSVVGLITSDYAQLEKPVARDAELSEGQVENMVRYAVAISGGLHQRIEPDAEWIVIKPNIVELKERGSGVITDWRVVKGLIKIVHEVVPDARITIAEGAAWILPEKEEMVQIQFGGDVGDGFALAGYRQLLDDPELAGIELDIVDLNYDETAAVSVPDGGYVFEKYHFPLTVLECDFLISVPVLKVIGAVGMTNAMKNFVGTAPGMIYGFPKMAGYPGSGVPGLPHNPGILDEVIVDLVSVAEPDFTVVDAIIGMERAKTDEDDGRAVRLNTILAGPDIVAVDAVSAQLIGFNPADIEYLTLGAYKGLGQADPSHIKVKGNDLQSVVRRFEKYHGDSRAYGDHGTYGQGCRIWLLKGPFDRQQGKEGEFIDVENPGAVPGQDGWSQAIYFHDDKIDLDKYYDDPFDCAVYAYATFTALRDEEVELWIGSDEGLRVWINGEQVYDHEGRRRHHLPNERLPIQIKAGENALLVRADQGRSRFDFSLNICTVEEDRRYAGNRLQGLTFAVPSGTAEAKEEFAELEFDTGEEGIPADATVLTEAKFARNLDLVAGSLEGALRFVGAEPTPQDLLGGTGHAFLFSVCDSLDMEGTFYTDISANVALYQNLGFELKLITAEEGAPDFADRQQEAWDAISESIDRGVPAVARFGPFFWVVKGYHPKREHIYISAFMGEEPVDMAELGTDEELGGLDVLIIGEPRPVDSASAARQVVQMAVEVARSQPKGPIYLGLDGYTHWAGEIENGRAWRGFGVKLVAGVTVARRAQAAPYLRQIAPSFGAEVAAQLEEAANCYEKEMEPLEKLETMFPLMGRGEEVDLENPEDRKKVIGLIHQAREWEEKAVEHLQEALALME
jgi:uncharacterized protein (DUF362 family)